MRARDRLRGWLARVVPAWAGRWLYSLLFLYAVARLQSANPGARIWARNSLVIGPLQFGLSDIDLSALLPRGIAPDAKSLPLVREINWYTEENLACALGLINPCELLRDPGLSRLAKTRGLVAIRAATAAQAFAFLLRMFHACQAQLTGEIAWQPRKWKTYFSLAGEHDFPATPEELFPKLAACAGRAGVYGFVEHSLRRLVEAKRAGRPDHELEDELLGVLFPQRFCFREPIASVSVPRAELMRAQTEWELWGILTQTAGVFTAEDRAHLRRLDQFLAASGAGPLPEIAASTMASILSARAGSFSET